ncbi:MAG: sulfurtransferase TusA family protein [Proteobacteria bacterium]|nr:sulfurtransferase TusA family protein [Pseudomonadota bacterium]MBU1389769.1 sulfurtransferase TusA family protein [Pseudomonadota bacterium]MBU1543778.1 sulfurtransferase TusA family protein [Pseudomonadota bacterium]MBU2431721.1 sulfurtransferase TusA family protein [Pseudomonadota bacterium]MBU2480133.1 sulfurtransferase TusA family protein [Pseudomonadota bacterium]
MTSKHTLDLRGVISPLNLLKCKNYLASMKPDEVLDVFLADTDVVKDLIIIVKKSRDRVMYQKNEADYICLGIKKGEKTQWPEF